MTQTKQVEMEERGFPYDKLADLFSKAQEPDTMILLYNRVKRFFSCARCGGQAPYGASSPGEIVHNPGCPYA